MNNLLAVALVVVGVPLTHATVQVPAPDAVMPKGGYSFRWTGCAGCGAPESAYFDNGSQFLFVSNVVGAPDQKDGQGWIQKLDSAGKVISAKWVEGLNAPKGMRSHRGTLWVSDIDQVVAISIATGKITERHVVEGAKFLNDVAVDPQGAVYVSDTVGSRIYKIVAGQVSIFAEGADLESPNGLLVVDDRLFVASWGAEMNPDWSTTRPGQLYSLALNGKARKKMITRIPLGNLDGLEQENSNSFLVSDWMAGKIYRVTRAGKVTELFSGMKGAADIGYVKSQRLLVIPRMGEDQVTAYDLGKYPIQ